MILIDKNKLIREVREKSFSKNSIKMIMGQPTVEAIPIEWIKNYANEHMSYIIHKMVENWEKENEIQV